MTVKRRITADDLYRFSWIGDPAVSPDGTRIAYASRTVNQARDGYRTYIRLAAADGSADRAFTSGTLDSAPAWSPDGSRLAFLRKQDKLQQVWTIPADGGEASILTPPGYTVSSFSWSPDGQELLFRGREVSLQEQCGRMDKSEPAGAPEVIVVDCTKWRADGDGIWDGRCTGLFVLDLATLEARPAVSGESERLDIAASVWSPSGGQIAFAAKIPEGIAGPGLTLKHALFVVGRQGGRPRRLTAPEYVVQQLAFTPDEAQLAFVAHDRRLGGATHNELYTIPVSGGRVASLSEGTDLHIGNAAVSDMRSGDSAPLVMSCDGASFYTLASYQGSVQLYRFSAAGGTAEPLTQGEREVYSFSGRPENGAFIVASAHALSPGDLYRLDLTTGKEVRLTESNDALLMELELQQPEPLWTTAPDGGDLHGWFLKPIGVRAGESYPAVLEIHGGPHAMYGSTFMHEFQLLAAQGYGVIYANPRGSLGYGQRFADACRGDYGGGDYMDVMAAVDYAVKQYPDIDRSRIGVTGGSYGGFLTNWIVGHTSRFRAAVTQRSISNWLSFYGVSDIGSYYTEEEIGGNPWEHAAALWKHSPLSYVHAVETPLLILHGEQDLRCPIEQAEQLYMALKKLGKTVQFVRFPGASHELSRSGHPRLRVERLNRIAGWFESHLG
ncbi:S9 family peptidase [Paenibacillus sp. y28]|uniref:S9 family peptidase n=1 Tax=Paenibacillus sp. y28 TaxID=3129110 RepID=UPI0030190511